jgi:hypothetical protein
VSRSLAGSLRWSRDGTAAVLQAVQANPAALSGPSLEGELLAALYRSSVALTQAMTKLSPDAWATLVLIDDVVARRSTGPGPALLPPWL